ncbi:MAG TPA: prolipoprotein diacylglyceryl transferase, partial [bacterium]|nr:prolipoprotein diacylglyceryl transferase [bacterium]
LGFVAGIWWSTREAKFVRIKTDFVLDLSFYIIVAALVGSRILYIAIDWQRYVEHPLDVIKIWEGGLVFYGGFIGAATTSLYYIRKHRQSFLKVADVFMPGLALGHAIGRLGCFAAGCCYGRPADPHSWWSVVFPSNPYSLAPAGVPIISSQLLESGSEFLIFLLLVFFRRRKSFDGQIFLLYLVFYSVSRSFLETLRGDSVRGFLIPGWLSTSQFISIGLVILAGFIYYSLHKRSRRTLI